MDRLDKGAALSQARLLVSVIIPTRNAASTLEDCLRSVASQSYPDIEIIIADNYSLDETRQIGKRYGGKIIIGGPPPPYNDFFTAPIQRKMGAMHASGDFLFFIDADMVLERKLIEECVKKCLEGADAIVVPEISFGEGFWSRCKIAERECCFDRSIGDQSLLSSRFIKRSSYELIGGWVESIGGLDDWDVTSRLLVKGFRVSRSNHFIFHNEGRLTPRRMVLKKLNIGKGAHPLKYLSSGGKTPRMIAVQLTPIRIITLLMKLPKLNKKPLEIFGVVLMKTIEGMAFITGLSISKLRSRTIMKLSRQFPNHT